MTNTSLRRRLRAPLLAAVLGALLSGCAGVHKSDAAGPPAAPGWTTRRASR
jgi:uncharacterized protein YceK